MKHITRLEAVGIIQETFPISDDEAQALLWGYTGWPSFFHTDDVESEIRACMIELKEKGFEKYLKDAGY